MVADDRRPVQGARQEGGHGVQEPLHADVLEARTAQDRVRPAGEGRPTQGGDDLVGGQLLSFEVGHVRLGELVIEVAQGVEHLLAPELGVGPQGVGDLVLGVGRALGLALRTGGPSW